LSFLTDDSDQDIDTLISSTFGDFLATAKEKERLKIIFTTIREHILNTISSADKRSAFSRTLLGTKQLLELENWVNENCDGLMSCEMTSEILQLIIQKLIEYSENKCLRAVITAESIPIMANMWIDGASYKQICDYASENDVKIIRRKKEGDIQLGEIIDICDDGFGYASTLIINAIAELMQLHYEEIEDTCRLLGELSRQMRYGLPSKKSIIIYESGFGDRVISLRLAAVLSGVPIKNKRQFQKVAKERKDVLMETLTGFPRIFSDRVSEI